MFSTCRVLSCVILVAGCASSEERPAPPPLSPVPVVDAPLTAAAPAFGMVAVVAAQATGANGPFVIATDASLLTGAVASEYLSLQKFAMTPGCSEAAGPEIKTAETGGLFSRESAQRLAAACGARAVVVLKTVVQQGGRVIKDVDIYSQSVTVSATVYASDGATLASAQRSDAIPCISDTLAPRSCRTVLARRLVEPALKECLLNAAPGLPTP